ncbi:MAG: helix-turn-helix transcriptional regulator [Alphaproteobacteria bacterium]|nr:helix-turn-helix transcriptional regulator [Alphaproteobacteria bacterium]
MSKPQANARAPGARLLFSTDPLPVGRRFAAFQDFCGGLFPIDFWTADSEAYRCNLEAQRVDSLIACDVSTAHVQATNALRADHIDSVCLQIVANGRVASEYGSDSLEVGPGGAFIAPCDWPGKTCYGDGTILRVLQIERSALRPLLGHGGPGSCAAVATEHPAMHLLQGWLRQLPHVDAAANSQMASLFAKHTVDLVAVLLGPHASARDEIAQGGIKAARLHAITDSIARNAARPNFNAEDVARELAISDRYVRLLLEPTGMTFSEHLLACRLELARTLLLDPDNARLKVMDIAMRSGFSDIAYFNRAFRRRFGETPTEMRSNGRQL